ncbi:sensor histidine kinase [Paenibacillus marinisediminis]
MNLERITRFRLFPEKYGYYPVVFLFYFLLPIYQLSLETGLKMIIGYMLLVVFIWSYRRLYFTENDRMFKGLIYLQLAIIILFCSLYNVAFIFMGFFTSNFVGWFSDKIQFRRIFMIFAAVIVLSFVINLRQLELREILFNLSPFVIVMLLSPYGVRSMLKRSSLERELDCAKEQISELVKSEERLRIARDLHDTLGHTLSLLTLKSQLVGRLLDKDPERARLEVKEMEQTSRAALKQVRELVADMRTLTLKEELAHVEKILLAAGIEYRYEGDRGFDHVSALNQNIASYCIREAVTNIVKHSQASVCSFRVQIDDGALSVCVRDDGIGMRTDNVQGNGMMGMKERLGVIGGDISWKMDSHSNGTQVAFSIPIVQQAEGAVL